MPAPETTASHGELLSPEEGLLNATAHLGQDAGRRSAPSGTGRSQSGPGEARNPNPAPSQ